MSIKIKYTPSKSNHYFDEDFLFYRNNRKEKTQGNPYYYLGEPIGDMRDNMGCKNKDISKDIITMHEEVEGIAFSLYQPTKIKENQPCVFYIHGGGFIGGSIKTVENPCKYLAMQAEAMVINIDYRLAPEFPYPTQIEDCLKVINYVYDTQKYVFNRKNIFIAGDSAGGNLALACMQADYHDKGQQRFKGGIVYYPVTDLTESMTYWKWNPQAYRGSDNAFVQYCSQSLKGSEAMMKKLYVQEKQEVTHPYISPLYMEDFSILPDILLFHGEYDYLRLQNEAFVQRAKTQCSIEEYCFEGINHAFLDLIGIVKQSQESIDIVSKFIKERV